MLSAIQVRKYDVSDIPNNDSGCKMSVSGKDKVSFVMRIYGTSRVCVCVCVCVCVTQFCPTLCDPMDYSLPGSSVHGILQARILAAAAAATAAAKSLQSCPTLCDPMDYSLLGSSVHGIF